MANDLRYKRLVFHVSVPIPGFWYSYIPFEDEGTTKGYLLSRGYRLVSEGLMSDTYDVVWKSDDGMREVVEVTAEKPMAGIKPEEIPAWVKFFMSELETYEIHFALYGVEELEVFRKRVFTHTVVTRPDGEILGAFPGSEEWWYFAGEMNPGRDWSEKEYIEVEGLYFWNSWYACQEKDRE